MLIQTTFNQLIQLQGPSQVSTVPNLQSFYSWLIKFLHVFLCRITCFSAKNQRFYAIFHFFTCISTLFNPFYTTFSKILTLFTLENTILQSHQPRRHLCRGSETPYFTINTCCTQQIVLLMLINNSEARGNPLFFSFIFYLGL